MRNAQDSNGYKRYTLTAVLAVGALAAAAAWSPEQSGTTVNLRGIHSAGPGVAWASGPKGTLLRSEDDGFVWQQCATPEDAQELDFRGIWGWDADHAIAMSSGPGDASRLYGTADGGAHWRLLFKNPDKSGFWDGIAMVDGHRGVLLGDPVRGRFSIWRTEDSGEHWTRDASPALAAQDGEGAFAASNSSLALAPGGDIYFGSGGKSGARIFRYNQHSKRWSATRAPLAGGRDAAGVFSLGFRDSLHGVAVGGDYERVQETAGTAAWTSDGGRTWQAATRLAGGYRSAVAWDETEHVWVAAGPSGTDVSADDGRTWKPFDKTGWNALSLPWAAGAHGMIAQVNSNALRGAARQ